MAFRVLVLSAVALLIAPGAIAAPDLDAARKSIKEAWAAHDTMRAEVAMDASLPTGQARLNIRGEGKVVYQKAEDTERYRILVTLIPPEPVFNQYQLDVLYDGEKVFTTNEAAGGVTEESTLEESEGFNAPGGDLLLRQLDAQHSLTRRDDAQVSGRDAFVLEAIPDSDAGSELPYARALIYVDQETGALLKTELFETPAVVATTIRFENFEWDVELEDETFKPVGN
jgi:outer membrane lipoprotein-sorting protein